LDTVSVLPVDVTRILTRIPIPYSIVNVVAVTGIVLGATGTNPSFDAAVISVHGNVSGRGYTVEGGIDLLYQFSTQSWFYSLTAGAGTNPLGNFKTGRGAGFSVTIGPVFNMSDPQQMSGASVSAVYPASIVGLLSGALFDKNAAWGAMSQLAKNARNVSLSKMIVGFGFSSSGPTFATLGLRSNSFGTYAFYSSKFYPVSNTGFQNLVGDTISPLRSVLSLAENGYFTSGSTMAAGASLIAQTISTNGSQH